MANDQPIHHFLIVTHPVQSHINPGRHLANRLASIPSCHVTFSTAISSHRNMFPSLSAPDQETTDHDVTYIPYSDGYDSGFDRSIHSLEDYRVKFAIESPKGVSAILNRLMTRDSPVSCIIYTLFLPWIHDVAQAYGLPTVHYWIQPATVLSIYYYYFHKFDSVFSGHMDVPDSMICLPGFVPLEIRNLPSIVSLVDDEILDMFREIFESLDRQTKGTNLKPKVLINTFEALEVGVLNDMKKHFEIYAVGPLIQSPCNKDQEEKNSDLTQYMKWLDAMPERSVVYVSFGGFTIVNKRQLEEIQVGFKDNALPYLWVVRKDSKVGLELQEGSSSNGMILEWCDQVMVLSHPSIGCFVTHHGWNSTLEGIMCGVPMVGIPQWSDQPTNAKLAEVIGVGVRAEASEGVVKGREINRCLEMVMKNCEGATEMRRNAVVWKEKLMEAMKNGGSSEMSLKSFLKNIHSSRGN